MKDLNIPSEKIIDEKLIAIESKINDYKNKETLLNIFNCIDHTSLNTKDSDLSIINFVQQVNDFNKYNTENKNVAAICVYPKFISLVKNKLTDKNIKIASVGACFPSSQTFISVKIAECELIAHKGADEVDIVISVGDFLNKEYEKVASEIKFIKEAIREGKLKVILETGELDSLENIGRASMLAIESGADFIKTSTGKTPISATPEAVYVMCCAIKEHFTKTGLRVGIKPSGGISTPETAIMYYLIVKEILGEEWLNNKLLRFGASQLTNNILNELKKY